MGLSELVAIGISVIALAISIWSARGQIHADAWAANSVFIAGLYQQITETPSILRFYGLTEQDLKEKGLELSEFVYLLANFEVGDAYYSALPMADEVTLEQAFSRGSYRYRLLQSEATRKAWPLIRPFIANGSYRLRVDETIRILEERSSEHGGTD